METRSIMKEYLKSTGIDDQGFFALKERIRIHQPALLQLFEHLEEIGGWIETLKMTSIACQCIMKFFFPYSCSYETSS